MSRRLAAAVAALVGFALGAAGALAVDAGSRATPAPPEAPAPPPTDALPATKVSEGVLLAWTPDRLVDGLEDALTGLPAVVATTVVSADPVDLVRSTTADGVVLDEPGEGWVLPLDAIAVDPVAYAELVPGSSRALVSNLGPTDVLLGETSARLRRLEPGDHLELAGGHRFTVAGVLADDVVGGAEVVLAARGAAGAGVTTPRYLLARFDGERDVVERAIRDAVDPSVALRVRGPGESPYLRHGDAVLPQALVKEQFGEFAHRPRPDGILELDPAWQAGHLTTVEVPLLGAVTCNRALIDPLVGAMADLDREGLGSLVDPDGFAGCFDPRRLRTGSELSRHAWGAAVDLNHPKNPRGLTSVQDPRLVEVMARWGFTWGGTWLVPDAAHFEYLHPPS